MTISIPFTMDVSHPNHRKLSNPLAFAFHDFTSDSFLGCQLMLREFGRVFSFGVSDWVNEALRFATKFFLLFSRVQFLTAPNDGVFHFTNVTVQIELWFFHCNDINDWTSILTQSFATMPFLMLPLMRGSAKVLLLPHHIGHLEKSD